MKKISYLLLAPLLLLGLTGCGSTSGSAGSNVGPQTLKWDIELWGSNFNKTSNGHCTGTDSRGNYENGSPVSLVGPDGSEISSATLTFGVLQATTMQKSSVTNFPTGNICDFSVTFNDVPEVSTYRVKTRDGVISPVSHALADVKAGNWSMGEVIGANFKQ